MFRKFILSQSKLYERPQLLQKQVLHKSGKKEEKKDKPKQQQQQPVIAQCFCPPVHYKILTMDDMPLPYGNWKKHYEKRNKSYKLILLFGLTSLIGSIKVLSDSIFFNAFIPPYPFDKEEVFDCTDDDEDCELECECEC